MKVFLSWSGKFSGEVAGLIKEKLNQMLHTMEFFLSNEDVPKGEDFDARVAKEMAQADCAILFCTQENLNSPWMGFDAGYFSGKTSGRVSGVLIDCDASSLKGTPLSKIACVELRESELFKLVAQLNQLSSIPINEKRLEYVYKMMWAEIKVSMNRIKAKY